MVEVAVAIRRDSYSAGTPGRRNSLNGRSPPLSRNPKSRVVLLEPSSFPGGRSETDSVSRLGAGARRGRCVGAGLSLDRSGRKSSLHADSASTRGEERAEEKVGWKCCRVFESSLRNATGGAEFPSHAVHLARLWRALRKRPLESRQACRSVQGNKHRR